jgi:hypothetical protein
MTDLRYITRLDYEGTRGYWVRYKQRSPLAAAKFFSDAKSGGKRRALTAALAFRDALLRKHPEERYGLLPNPGTLKQMWRTQGPWQYLSWHAEIQISPRKRLKRSWSVTKYGDSGAKQRAQAWLSEQRRLQQRAYPALQRSR